MKIRAIEVEESGKITRYVVAGELRAESEWDAPESFKYKQEEEGPLLGGETKCVCGHAVSLHLPECIYKVEGCECEGYAEAISASGS